MASHGFHETSNDIQNTSNIPMALTTKIARMEQTFRARKNEKKWEKMVEQKLTQMTNVSRGERIDRTKIVRIS